MDGPGTTPGEFRPDNPHDPYAALRLRNVRLYLGGNVVSNLGMQMQDVAIGWEIYERTGSAMALGWVGLVLILPVIALALPAGHVADNHDRRRIVMVAQVFVALSSLGLTIVSVTGADYRLMYLMLLGIGTARAFSQPARSSLFPQIVPRERFSNAVTWNSGGFQIASVLGPAIGGGLIGLLHRAAPVYVLNALAAMTWFAAMKLIVYRPEPRGSEAMTLRSLSAGIRFLWHAPTVLGAITLDMFAVLLGGAGTLLPIYAKDILCVGPEGLGWMRAAPGLGALCMAAYLAYRPPLRKAGRALLWSVAAFGVATIVFGLSRSYWLSLAMLFVTGAVDNVSVVVRHTLVQLLTPDAMRGRVSAINSMFIGASNELGGFESGLVAALFTPTVSVVSGGIGTLLVVAAVALACPTLVRYGRLGEPEVRGAKQTPEGGGCARHA